MDLYRYEKHTYRTSFVFYLYKTNLTRRVDRSRYTKIRGGLLDGNNLGLMLINDALRCYGPFVGVREGCCCELGLYSGIPHTFSQSEAEKEVICHFTQFRMVGCLGEGFILARRAASLTTVFLPSNPPAGRYVPAPLPKPVDQLWQPPR